MAANGQIDWGHNEIGAMPAELAHKFDALPASIRDMFAGPIKSADRARTRVEVCAVALRHNGWLMPDAIDLADYFPVGFGILGTQTAPVIAETWLERDKKDAEAETARTRRQNLSATTLLQRKFPAEENLLGPLVTRTSRTFLVGPTGAGKTNLGLALAGGMASGQGFGEWRSDRPARVLYIDGEMPLSLLQQRVRDMGRRLGNEDALANLFLLSWQDAPNVLPPDPAVSWAPLNTPEGQAFILQMCDLIAPDVVMLDNVQCLLAGDLKEEGTWKPTLPLVCALTARSIGQVWFDHTGHEGSRQYGTSTKAWTFDTVGNIKPLSTADCEPGDLAFSLSFDAPGKARRRTPETWREFAPCTIRLRDDLWTVEGAAPRNPSRSTPAPLIRKFHEALIDALAVPTPPGERARPGWTTMVAWEAECVRRGLIDFPEQGERSDEKNRRRAGLRKAKSTLLGVGWIGIDGNHVANSRPRR